MSQNDMPAGEAAGKEEKKGRKGFGVNFKVSQKGAVSVYGLGRFPVTLYREQWVRLLERADDLRQFMEEHASELKSKGEGGAEAGEAGGSGAEAGAAQPEPAASEPAAGGGGDEVAVTSEDAGGTYPPGGSGPAA